VTDAAATLAVAMSNEDPATPEEILRALADPERLAVAGMLAREPRSAADLASALDLPIARVRRHLTRLATVGLARVEPDRRTHTLVPETLRHAGREVGPLREPGVALGATDQEEESVLRQYFRGGKLRGIPAGIGRKRRIVMTRLALEFEPGVHYSERQVNQTLKRFHPDHAALRRYLVEEGFLDRAGGEYWRSGGPVDV
jgi:hypothetical protein